MKGTPRSSQKIFTYDRSETNQDALHLLIAEHQALTGEMLNLTREFRAHVSTLSALLKGTNQKAGGRSQAVPETENVHD